MKEKCGKVYKLKLLKCLSTRRHIC